MYKPYPSLRHGVFYRLPPQKSACPHRGGKRSKHWRVWSLFCHTPKIALAPRGGASAGGQAVKNTMGHDPGGAVGRGALSITRLLAFPLRFKVEKMYLLKIFIVWEEYAITKILRTEEILRNYLLIYLLTKSPATFIRIFVKETHVNSLLAITMCGFITTGKKKTFFYLPSIYKHTLVFSHNTKIFI